MKKYLLDTHYLIWVFKQPEKVRSEILSVISDPKCTIFVSLVSLWEMAIKIKIGKLEIVDSLAHLKQDLIQNDYKILPIYEEHIFATLDLPLHHRDPFDRLIIAQAKVEQLTLISDDKNFIYYDVDLL